MMTSTDEIFERARTLHRQGALEQAADTYREALRRQPGHIAARHGLGLLLLHRGDLTEAAAELEQVSRLAPDQVEPYVQRGHVLQRLGYLPEALACFDAALARRPAAPLALYERGVALHSLQRNEEAIASFDALIALQPSQAMAHYGRANALHDEARLDEALAAYDRAIALQPAFPEAFRNRGMVKLLRGDFTGGLADYEYRRPKAGPKSPVIAAIPEWTGGDIEGKSILVSDASGLGDTLQFSRYLLLLQARGASVSFCGHPRLFRLLRTLSSTLRLLPEVARSETFDLHCKLLSLPYLFRTTLQSVPNAVPYLHPEPALAVRWAERLGTGGFKVGICWQGNPGRAIDAGRSIPLRAFAPLLQVPGIRLISLQKNFGLEQLSSLPAGSVETLGDAFDSGDDAFVDSAAVIANLDLVVSSDTSIAHLAGALARPAWIALRAVPEWRWMMTRADSPWYPSLRLFRQSATGDWQGVFDAMAQALIAQARR
jgi:tetratricopeptide (TPR) repeat protein